MTDPTTIHNRPLWRVWLCRLFHPLRTSDARWLKYDFHAGEYDFRVRCSCGRETRSVTKGFGHD